MKKVLLTCLSVVFMAGVAFAQSEELKKGELGYETLAKLDMKDPKLSCNDAKKFLDMITKAAKESEKAKQDNVTSPEEEKLIKEIEKMGTAFETKYAEKDPEIFTKLGTNLLEIMLAAAIEMDEPTKKGYGSQVVGVSNCGAKPAKDYVSPMDMLNKEAAAREAQKAPETKNAPVENQPKK